MLCANHDEASYKLLMANSDMKNQIKEFNMDEKLGIFNMSCLSQHVELREVVKLVVILSHGNSCVESGFSANEEMLVENMSEGSFVAQRMVFHAVINEGGVSNVNVNRKMLKFVSNALLEYVKQLEKQKEQQSLGEKKRAKERKIVNELKKVKEAKQKFTEQLKQKTAELESQIFNLEQPLRKMYLLVID